jgi:hypothetical protein
VNVTTAAWATEEGLARARELWDAGLSATAIGRHVGASKSAIVGYAHRHGWPQRPSPVGRPKPPRADVPTPRRRPPRDPAALRVTCNPEPLAVPTAAFRGCQWTDSERRPWRMCGAPVARPGVAYCAEHFPRCYHRPPRWSYAAEAAE